MRSLEGSFASSLMLDVDEIPREICGDPNQCRQFVIDLCELIHMKRHGEPVREHFGDGHLAGWTVVQLIETSHVVAHFMDPPKTDASALGGLHLDVCSCAHFEPRMVVWMIESRWPGSRVRVRHDMRRSPGELRGREAYDAVSASYDSYYSGRDFEYEDKIVGRNFAGMFPDNMLDLGCGTGGAHRILCDVMGAPPRKYVGIDVSSTMLGRFWTKSGSWIWSSGESRYFRDVVRDREVTIDLVKSDIACPGWRHELRDESFDMVTCLWTLPYLMKKQLLWLGEAVLGLVSEYNTPWVITLFGDSFMQSGRYLDPHKIAGKIVTYIQPRDVVLLLQEAGWKVEHIEGLSGPMTRRWNSRASEWIDRQWVSDPWDPRYLGQVVRLVPNGRS